MRSTFKKLKEVYLPEFSGTRILMLPFLMEDIGTLPNDLSHYHQTVTELVDISPVKKGVAYLTIDEKEVKVNETHRMGGLHVDGIGSEGQTVSDCIWATVGLRNYISSMWSEGKWDEGADRIGGMITVSNPAGCRAWNKLFVGKAKINGNCEHLREQFPESEATIFESSMAYWCNFSCVHESMMTKEGTPRTFVRLSMPSDAPWYAGYTKNPKGIHPTGATVPFSRANEPEVILKG